MIQSRSIIPNTARPALAELTRKTADTRTYGTDRSTGERQLKTEGVNTKCGTDRWQILLPFAVTQ